MRLGTDLQIWPGGGGSLNARRYKTSQTTLEDLIGGTAFYLRQTAIGSYDWWYSLLSRVSLVHAPSRTSIPEYVWDNT
jgi:hypothetical protein